MDAKKTLNDLNKIPIIGDFIISFAIIVVLTTLSSAGGFWGLEGDNKTLLINVFIGIGILYFISSVGLKFYSYITKN